MRAFVAASLGDVVAELAQKFESQTGTSIRISQGSSGRLARQILDGAPCDLFLPADVEYLALLEEKDLIVRSSRRRLAGNSLVLIGGRPSGQQEELGEMLRRSTGFIAIASPEHAPAGKYARQALQRAHLWTDLQPRIRYADDVRFAARYVADGVAAFGVVYRTDAQALGGAVHILHEFSAGDHDPIRYEAALIARASARELAREFIHFASDDANRGIWKTHGFAAP
ncbi:MAG TPA: molybdate ABC transporter substrate-binding protein [Phycisphaerae bacterium]|nr:molybdate ABC transporter substrate-binding protein [Phycisphaerae bacterium]